MVSSYAMDRATLEHEFGSYAQRLYELARGIDQNPVVPNRIRKQISAEDTFPEDIPLSECEPHIRKLAQKVWTASKDNRREAKTVVLKLKTKEFQSLTRSLTSRGPIPSCETLVNTALNLCERVELEPQQLYRLVGVGSRTGAMKVSELCELLGVDDKHVYRMAARGKLPSFHVGGSVRFDSQEVANWLRSKYSANLGAARKPPVHARPQGKQLQQSA
jgi:excisionase family DNA binding protein